jgi:hypothetical protein
MTVALTLSVLNTYPPKVSIAASGLTPGTTATVYRTAAGSNDRTPVRGANGVVLASDGFVVEDGEQPYGVELTYTLQIDGVDTAAQIVTLQLDKVAISDAINGNAAEVVVTAWPEKQRTRNASTFQIAGRNVVVVGERGQFTSTLEVYTETEDARLNLLNVLDNATSGILQIRQGGAYMGVDAYVAVTGDIEKRWSQDGSDQRRTFSLDVVEVGPWADGLQTNGFTYQDVADAYTGLTYANLAADYPTYLALAQGDFS